MKNARTIGLLGAIACTVALFAGCATDEAATTKDGATCSEAAAACSTEGKMSCSTEKSCSEKAAKSCCSESKDAAKN